ncbi:MAG: hypothetical protein ACK5L3_11780 [Oscillospiraceae bacterium]
MHQRIRMLFGAPYGVTMKSSRKYGTVFELCLPLIWGNTEGDMEQNETDHAD